MKILLENAKRLMRLTDVKFYVTAINAVPLPLFPVHKFYKAEHHRVSIVITYTLLQYQYLLFTNVFKSPPLAQDVLQLMLNQSPGIQTVVLFKTNA